MVPAEDVKEILPGIFRWEVFSTEHKVELTSHAVRLGPYLYIFDPIPLKEPGFSRLLAGAKPVGIVLTNDNHERDAANWRQRLQTPIWASVECRLSIPLVYRFMPSIRQWFDWELHRISGGSNGEIGFYHKRSGLMVTGDALTNLPKYGLNILTEKYCADQQTLRHNLKHLALAGFEKLLLSHGNPLLEKASSKVEGVLSQ